MASELDFATVLVMQMVLKEWQPEVLGQVWPEEVFPGLNKVLGQELQGSCVLWKRIVLCALQYLKPSGFAEKKERLFLVGKAEVFLSYLWILISSFSFSYTSSLWLKQEQTKYGIIKSVGFPLPRVSSCLWWHPKKKTKNKQKQACCCSLSSTPWAEWQWAASWEKPKSNWLKL